LGLISDVEIRVINPKSLTNQLDDLIYIFWGLKTEGGDPIGPHRRPCRAYLILLPSGRIKINSSLSFVRRRHACILTEFRASPKRQKQRVLYIARESLARDFEDEIRDILLGKGVILKIEGE
jgi:hypothetical protein